MKERIQSISDNKFASEFDKPKYFIIRILGALFILFGLLTYLISIMYMWYNATLENLLDVYLFITASGCILMGAFIIFLIYKSKKLDIYQNEMTQVLQDMAAEIKCVKDSLYTGTLYSRVLDRIIVVIQHMSNTQINMIFRTAICQDESEYEEFVRVLNTDIKNHVDDRNTLEILAVECLQTVGDVIHYYHNLALDDDTLEKTLRSLHPIIDNYFDYPHFLENIVTALDKY